MSHTIHAAFDFMQLASTMPAVANPFDGIQPSFDFGTAFNAMWKKVFAVIWGGAIVLSVVWIIVNLAKAGKGSSSSNPHEVSQARGGVKQSLIIFGILLALMPILAVAFYVIQ